MKHAGQRRFGVIFDMDGVIVDTEPIHFEAMKIVLGQRGHLLIEGLFCTFVGRRADECYAHLKKRYLLDEHVPHLIREHDSHYGRLLQERLREGTLPAAPGVVDLLKSLKESHIPRGLVSGSARWQVNNILKCLNLEEYFQTTVAGDELVEGKPDPEGFLRCSRSLALPSTACIVIEDSPHGIEAARRASMKVVGVLSRYMSKDAYRTADLTVLNLEELCLDQLIQLFS